MITKELTCVVCPAGCKISVVIDDSGKITEMSGYTCARGQKYAESEVTAPVRTLTSTVVLLTDGGKKMLPVRTDKPIPKGGLFEAMRLVRKIRVASPVKMGDVIAADFIEDGTNLIACKDFE